MTIKIHDQSPPSLQVPKEGRGNIAEGRGKSPRAGEDSVSLTGQARQLKAIEEALAEQPDVDAARVAALREAIESGTYRIDIQRLAANLFRSEILDA